MTTEAMNTLVDSITKEIVSAGVTYSEAMDVASRLMGKIGELKLTLPAEEAVSE